MNWGHKITITFILFAAIIITMVTISMRQDINLVAPNYYEQELVYQNQIDRMSNYNRLKAKPSFNKYEDRITFNFPDTLASEVIKGEIILFRPSHSKSDQKHSLNLSHQNQQSIPTQGMSKGLWKVKLSWVTSDREYYNEQTVVI